jgi:hypothetical protein
MKYLGILIDVVAWLLMLYFWWIGNYEACIFLLIMACPRMIGKRN